MTDNATARRATPQSRPRTSGIDQMRVALRVPVSWLGLLRGLTAAAVVVAADIHFVLWYHDGFRDIPQIGPLFLLNAVGVLVVAWPNWISTLLAAGFGLLTLIGFYLSVTVGLFGVKELRSGGPQFHAEIAEWAALVLGLAATWLLWRRNVAAHPDRG